MNTKLMQVSDNSISLAANLINNGEIVAIPTETVYGLAASSLNSEAVKKIFKAKGRPCDNPLISHICNIEMLSAVTKEIPQSAYLLAENFWPGPLTIVLQKNDNIAYEVCAGLSTAAVRMPKHPDALKLIKACGVPLAAPSANLSGSPSPTTAQHVFEDMNGKIPLIIDGGKCEIGIESTVLSLCGEKPVLLRPGHVSIRALESVLKSEILVSPSVLNELTEKQTAISPGMKYKHYSPKASLILVKGSLSAYNKLISQNNDDGVFRLCFNGEQSTHTLPCVVYGSESNPAELERCLFSSLRELDKLRAKIAYVRCPKSDGDYLAIYNRLLRASGFKIMEV